MRNLRIAELIKCKALDEFLEDLKSIPDLHVDRYNLHDVAHHSALHLFKETPISQGGLDFPMATLETNGEKLAQAEGLDNVRALLDELKIPCYATTRHMPRPKKSATTQTKIKQRQIETPIRNIDFESEECYGSKP